MPAESSRGNPLSRTTRGTRDSDPKSRRRNVSSQAPEGVESRENHAEQQAITSQALEGGAMRNKLGLATIIALVLVVASITLASASGSGGGSSDHGVQVIRLVVKGVQESNIDLGKKGFSQGDQEIVGLNVLRGGKKIGEAGQICQFVRVTQASATDLCQVALSLPKGQITAQGLIKSTAAGPGTFFLAITGGTGAYQTAHGQVKITATATNEVPVTLYVIL